MKIRDKKGRFVKGHKHYPHEYSQRERESMRKLMKKKWQTGEFAGTTGMKNLFVCSKEERKRRSERMKGDKNPLRNPETVKKHQASRKGYVASKETCRKQSEALKGKIPKNLSMINANKLGKGNPMWIDGRTPIRRRFRSSSKYRCWIRSIFKRDNWTCQKCKARRREGSVVVLNAHHKKSFAVILNEHNIKTYKDFIGCDEIWEIDNGITFCDKCHTEFHTKYGTTNNTLEQTKEFLKK